MPAITLRPATRDDRYRLFYWRNDPLTRQNSRDSKPVLWTSHIAWIERVLMRPTEYSLLIAVAHRPVGVIRLDLGAPIELSWTVAPEHRKQGYGTAMLQEAVKILDDELFAEIKHENIPSITVATRAGFSLTGEIDGMMKFVRPRIANGTTQTECKDAQPQW